MLGVTASSGPDTSDFIVWAAVRGVRKKLEGSEVWSEFIDPECVTGSVISCQIMESAGGVSVLTGRFVSTVYLYVSASASLGRALAGKFTVCRSNT